MESPQGKPRGVRQLATCLLCLAIGTAVALPVCVRAAEREVVVRGALLFSLTKFIQWPSPGSTTASLVICVIGDPEFAEVLHEKLHGRSLRDRKIEVRGRRAARLPGCDVAYLGSPAPELEASDPAALHGALTVSSEPGFVDAGGMVGFIRSDGKLRLELNPAAAAEQGIRFDSRLLRVAVRVVSPQTVEKPR